MKSPVMPSNLPPLPMGGNGKPLVYLGAGGAFKYCDFIGYMFGVSGSWDEGTWNGRSRGPYAARSDSPICLLNGWGDFEEPETPQTRLEAYRDAIRKEREEAEKMSAEAAAVAEQWRKRLIECVEAETRMTEPTRAGESALSRKAWFDYGKKIEREHAKSPTIFTVWPLDRPLTQTPKE